jgi:hypothetical protein
MVFISDSDISQLLEAVPSFQESWRKSEDSEARYAAEYPDDAQSPEERANAFLGDLAYHVGRSVAKDELHEVEWLGAALEKIYSRLSEDAAVELTVCFLESLVYGTEYAGGDASKVTPFMIGPHSRWRWHRAYGYTRSVYLYNQEPDKE